MAAAADVSAAFTRRSHAHTDLYGREESFLKRIIFKVMKMDTRDAYNFL